MIQHISHQKLTEHCSASTELSLCRFVLVRNLLFSSAEAEYNHAFAMEEDFANETHSHSVPMDEDNPVLYDEEEWFDACLGDLEEMEDFDESRYEETDLSLTFEPEIGFDAGLIGSFSSLPYPGLIEASAFYRSHRVDPPTPPQLDAYFTL